MPLRLIVPTNTADKSRIFVDYTTSETVSVADQVRNDTQLEITVEPVRVNPAGSETLFSPDHEASDSYQVAAGLADGYPTSGTFTLTGAAGAGTTTSAQAYNVSAASLQTALAVVFTDEGEAAPTVTEVATGLFYLVGSSNGALPTGFLVGDADNLFPASSVSVHEEDLGSVSTPYRLYLVIRQSPLVAAAPATQLTAAGVSVSDVQALSSSANRIQRIEFDVPDTYGGRYSITATVWGQAVTITARPTWSADELAAALTAAHPFIHWNTPDLDDNIAVRRTILETGVVAFDVEWIGNLAPQPILTATAANPTVITTQGDHGYVSGYSVTIAGNSATGSPAINGTFTVTVTDDDTFTVPSNVSVAGTGGTVRPATAPVLAVTDIDLLAPKGVSGVLNNNTIALYKYSRTQTTQTFTLLVSVTRTRASGERKTIFGPTEIIFDKDLIDTATMIPTPLASYYTASEADGLFVKKVTTGTDGSHVLEIDAPTGTTNLIQINNDVGFTGSDLNSKISGVTQFDLNQGFVFARNGYTQGANLDPLAPILSVCKTADTTRTSTASPSADPDLVLGPIAANQKWAFEFIVHLAVESSSPNWKGGLTFPSSPTAVRWTFTNEDHGAGTLTTIPAFTGNDTSNTVTVDTTDGNTLVLRGFIQNGANAGNITLSWSQQTSHADDTKVLKCSHASATLIP